MKLFKTCRPPYHQIVISDPTAKVVVPPWKKGVPLVSTDTCILCACMPDMDGDTDFTLGTSGEVGTDHPPIFEGRLKTPGCKIALETVEGDPVLEMATAGTETLIRVWTNREREPDIVIVGVD